MAAATDLQGIFTALHTTSPYRPTITIRSLRFLLTQVGNYTYDEFFRELKINGKCVARGTRNAVEYLWERMDKAGLIDWESLAENHKKGVEENIHYWTALDAKYLYERDVLKWTSAPH